MKRPMVFIGTFSALSALLCALGLNIQLICTAAALSAAVLAVIFRRSLLPLVLAAVFSIVIAAEFSAAEQKALRLAEEYDGKELVISGTVHGVPDISGNREVCVLDTDLGLVELTRYGERSERPDIGDTMTLPVRLSAPSLPENDYAFNSRQYYYSRKIFLTASDEGDADIERCSKLSPSIIAGRLRKNAVSSGEKKLSGTALELYGAVVFGDRSLLSYELRRSLTNAGLSHIAAVSGMHLSTVVLLLTFLGRCIFGNGRLCTLLCIAAVVGFTLITGAGYSVVRSCIMSLIILFARLFRRDADSLSSLGAAATVMLLFNPMVIYNAGFQLSALSTLGILLFVPIADSRLCKLPKPVRIFAEAAVISLSAQLGLFPVLIFQFNSFPTYFLLSNLLAAPLIAAAMLFGLMLPLFSEIAPIAELLGKLCNAVFSLIAEASERIASLPYALIPARAPSPLLFAAYIFAVAALLMLLKGIKRWGYIACAALILGSAGMYGMYLDGRVPRVSFLNVGRGDCTVFRLSDGSTVLADVGTNAYTVEDYLLGCGMGCAEALIITNAGSEHLGAAEALLADGAVKRLYLPYTEDESFRHLAAVAKNLGIKAEYYSDRSDIRISNLHISAVGYNEGMALLAEHGGTRILLCSDGYTEWADCDIVKTPNHGTGEYNYANEIEAASPLYAVVSGNENALSRCAYSSALTSRGVRVFHTASCGTVEFSLGDKIEVRTTK